MANLKFFTLLVTLINLTFIDSKTFPKCECIDFINVFGQGNCQKSNITTRSDTNLCYVKVPSLCPDVKNSSLFFDKQISRKACELYSVHTDFKNNGAKINEMSYCFLLPFLTKLTLSQRVVITN